MRHDIKTTLKNSFFDLLNQFCVLSLNPIWQTEHWRVQPVGLGGGGQLSDVTNLTYSQISISPRISATLFWKCAKNQYKFWRFFFGKNDILTPTLRLNGCWLWQWRPHWRLEEALIVKRMSSKLDANCQRKFHGKTYKCFIPFCDERSIERYRQHRKNVSFVALFDRSLRYIRESRGLRTVHWGQPAMILCGWDILLPTRTTCVLSVR